MPCKCFCEAAHANNFTLAAKKLNMTQPAVSMQIKTLEDQLQVKLFERHGRSMQVTQAGQALIPRARHIIALAIQTEELMRAAKDEVLGDLTVGCSLPSANPILIHLAARFQQLYPLVRMRIPTVSNEELIQKIVHGEYNLGIMQIVKQCDPLECQPLFEDAIVLIAPAMHPFSQRDSIQPAELRGQKFVCQGSSSACRYAVHDALKPYDVDTTQFDVRMEIQNHAAIVTAVEQGVGLAFVSYLDALHGLAKGTIHLVRIDNIYLKTTIGLAFSDAHALSLASLKFRGFMTHPRTQMEINHLIQTTRQSYNEDGIYA
jgi:DNA-binding transcriptional LysR family regulator